uniref:Saccharopine dehydrogenase-like oxidoreductase n=1 Tax=Felis catus TaxID=9685 RepID=A0ABI7WRZ7_FELCA
METNQRPYHLVVFGASGFTGQFVAEEVAREQVASGQSSSLPWAVAGRSREKLQRVLERAALKLGRPTLSSEVGIIICDVTNPASLDEMAKQAAIVLNCVGPYRFYGEPVVKACVENGTSCIDICGEPQFLELMYWKYHEKAAEKGAYIIGSSGFDSIPADLGVIYTKNKMNGTLTAVESFLTIHSGPEGMCIHDGTWKSAVYGFGDQSNLKKLRNEANLKPVPIIGPKLKRRWPVSYCRELSSYSVPFLGADVSVVRRTQRYLHENLEQSPVQYAAYVNMGGITSVIKLMFAGLFFLFFVRFGIGRQLLIKFPWLFSFGYFSKQGPTQKQVPHLLPRGGLENVCCAPPIPVLRPTAPALPFFPPLGEEFRTGLVPPPMLLKSSISCVQWAQSRVLDIAFSLPAYGGGSHQSGSVRPRSRGQGVAGARVRPACVFTFTVTSVVL